MYRSTETSPNTRHSARPAALVHGSSMPRSSVMSAESPQSGFLEELRNPRRDSLDRLVPVVYDELRAIAHRHLAGSEHGGSLATTGLVHEAYLKLVDQSRAEWHDRAHFFALSSV